LQISRSRRRGGSKFGGKRGEVARFGTLTILSSPDAAECGFKRGFHPPAITRYYGSIMVDLREGNATVEAPLVGDVGSEPLLPPRPWVSLIAFGYPVLLLGSIIGSWLAAWFVLGRMPQPALDDPKQILGLVHDASVLVLCFMPVGMAAALYHAASQWTSGQIAFRTAFANSLSLLVFWLHVIFLLRGDPFKIVTWWLD
jgi:hypothetical protein